LVENALRHGIAHRPEAGRITVGAAAENGRVRLWVTDNGAGTMAEGRLGGAGVGLANTRARLAQHYGAAAQLTLVRARDETVATIELPRR
jgi:hypothetical protein